MAARSHFDNPARREWWSVHVEAWQRSGLSRRKYCRVHKLTETTVVRWIDVLTDAKTAKSRVERAAAERRADDELAAAQALADVVVDLALEQHGDAGAKEGCG